MRTLASTFVLVLILLYTLNPAHGQRDLSGAADIALRLEKLNVLGSALMIAAHPDDENTALLAYLMARTPGADRLSFGHSRRGRPGPHRTRAGRPRGMIRTQELLAARRIDGAEQFFTRAIDFGFTKTPEETLAKWGHDRILSDMVWTIRHYRPDVVILRFSGTPRDGHGQHQASAILGKEAYFAAADPKRFPEQQIEPWKAGQLIHNIPTFSRDQETQAAATPGRLEIDTGAFNPILGMSYSEIAALSRSQHRSQAMGAAAHRGPSKNYLTVIGGAPAAKDIFEGVDVSWTRLPGGAAVAPILAEAERTFSISDPAKTIPLLLKARPLIVHIAEGEGRAWAEVKLRELDEAVAACGGLWVDVDADRAVATPGSVWTATLSAVNRSRYPLKWLGPETALEFNDVRTRTLPISIPPDEPYSQPFWLVKPKVGSSYTIDRQEMRDRPDNPPFYTATFEIQAGTERIALQRPLHFRYVDPERGALDPACIGGSSRRRASRGSCLRIPERQASARAGAGACECRQRIRRGPDWKWRSGWKVEPAVRAFHLQDVGEQAEMNFDINPSTGPKSSGDPRRSQVRRADDHFGNARHQLSPYPGRDHLPRTADARAERYFP